ncbi:hypothetical protein GCM10007377_15930 [Galliscardovia ingluviei]|uniref:Uncharacterized protein n=1 Tax=Galliscardovia ingluviei TaxID=1769422 RepID=A0A8J3AMI2_9BIFI|nr:hypothetical protein GCM10007377_15930 [Galliscardovia ingluviei]
MNSNMLNEAFQSVSADSNYYLYAMRDLLKYLEYDPQCTKSELCDWLYLINEETWRNNYQTLIQPAVHFGLIERQVNAEDTRYSVSPLGELVLRVLKQYC